MVYLADLLNFNLTKMEHLQQITNTIKQLNPTVGEVLVDKLEQENLDAFAKIVSNFIKLNCDKEVIFD